MYYTFRFISKEEREEANQIAEDLGYGPDNFSIPLVEKGTKSPIIYYGCSWAIGSNEDQSDLKLELQSLNTFSEIDSTDSFEEAANMLDLEKEPKEEINV